MADEYVMPTYVVNGIDYVKKPQTQAQKRRHHSMTDQYGRAWETTIDNTSKPHPAPCSSIMPLGWHDPLDTPAQYKKFQPENIFKLHIDVRQWEEDRARSHSEWDAKLVNEAAAMSPADQGASLIGKGGHDVSPALLLKVGEKPQPVEFVQALVAGNKWARGETDQVPDWARKLMPIPRKSVSLMDADDLDSLRAKFPDVEDGDAEDSSVSAKKEPEVTGAITYQDFVKSGSKGGMTLPKIAIAWAEHKKNVKAEEVAAQQ